MPQKSVWQNDCERCGRTWYSDSEEDTPKVVVRMEHKGTKLIDSSYDVLCESCSQTVQNLLKALAKDMKKLGASKPKAKKEGADAPSEPSVGSTPTVESPAVVAPVVDTDSVRTPTMGPPRSGPSGPSRRP